MTEAFTETGGGPAANAAFLLSRWGVRTAFAGLVGADCEGDKILVEFDQAGTDTSLIERRKDFKTPLSAILVSAQNGSRTIITAHAPKADFELDRSRLTALNPKIIIVDGWRQAASLQAIAALPTATVILDAGSLRPATADLLVRAHYAVCSERFAAEFSGTRTLKRAADQRRVLAGLFNDNRNNVAVTLGSEGTLWWDNGRVKLIKAFKVKAMDTTAAGDIFHGAFAWAVLNNRSFHDALVFASAAAALSVTKPGGRSSIPPLDQVLQFQKNPSVT